MQELTQARLKELLSYDPETGVFTWIVNKQSAGKTAGIDNGQGYLKMAINGKSYAAHRLAWLYVYGEMPKGLLDHANGVKADNRILNLRECSSSQNSFNVGIRCNNVSGFKGVHWHKRNGKWRARIRNKGKNESLGLFSSAELASAAYNAKASEIHGEFYRATQKAIY